jgi:hypothetical protein
MKKMMFVLFIFIVLSAYATKISMNDAEIVALNWFKNNVNSEKLSILSSQSYTKGEILYFYYFVMSDGSYAVVSATDKLPPVLAYSTQPNEKLNLNQLNPLLSDMVKQIEYVQENDTIERHDLWNSLLKNHYSNSMNRNIEPLVFSVWGTGNPWNGDLPFDPQGDGNRVDVGSMAVSLGMVMKYWNHPANGTGQYSYVHPDYGQQYANFENTVYNWNRMPNTFPHEATLVLLEHCAISIETDYGPVNSYASLENSYDALLNYFKYAESASYIEKSNFSDTQWQNILRNELENERPVLYRGKSGEHEIGFICDGYQGDDFFHFNWGREGENNGYYLLSALTPGNDNFTNEQAAIIGIEPTLGPITINENFENEFHDFNWYFGGAQAWSVVPEEHYYGTHSAKSGAINHNQQSILQIDINVSQDGEISFFRKVSCEDDGNNNYDYLAFYIDNIEIDRWGGEREWSYQNYPVTSGMHNFKWSYKKDGSIVNGQDCAWIDAIDFPEGSIAVNPPQNLTAVLVGMNNIQLNWNSPVPNPDFTQLGYRIFRNGVSISTINNTQTTTYYDQMLANGLYQYFVKAIYAEGISDPSNLVGIEIEVPYPPSNLYTIVNNSDVTLQWDRPPSNAYTRGLSGYLVIRDNMEIATIPNAQTLIYQDVELPNGTYYYVVRAIYSDELSEPSNTAVAAVGVPNPPLQLQAVLTEGNNVILSWLPPQISPLTVTGYQILRNAIFLAEIPETELTYQDSNLANGAYYYTVKAVYDNELSGNSNVAMINIEIAYPPRNLNNTIQNGNNVKLTWNIPENGSRSLLSYKVYKNGTPIASILNPAVLTYTDFSLPNSIYEYFVTAIYSGEESGPSNITVADVEVPYPPTNLQALVLDDDVQLNWELPADGSRALQGFQLFRNNEILTTIPNPNIQSYSDIDVSSGTYSYFVKAIYNQAVSAPSNTVIVAIGIPYPPINLTAVVENENNVRLTWTEPQGKKDRDLIGYKVYRNNQEIIEISNPNATEYIDMNLANGTFYYFLKAVYEDALSDPSNIVSINIEVLYPPQNLTTEIYQENSVNLFWQIPVTGPNRALSGYQIFRNNQIIAAIFSPHTTYYQDSNLTNGYYEYYIKAMYGNSVSNPSNVSDILVEVLYPPQNLTGTIFNENDIRLNWNLPATNGGLRNLLGYRIYRNSQPVIDVENPQTTYFEDINVPNGNHQYYLTALYSSGESVPGNNLHFFIEVLYPPENLSANTNFNSIELTWNKPSNLAKNREILSYNIFRNNEYVVQIPHPDSLSYLDSNLENGIYFYYLTASYSSGDSSPSNTVEIELEIPYAPQNLSAALENGNDVILNWQSPQTANRIFQTYRIYRNQSLIQTTQNTTFTDIALANGVFDYYVTALYTSGESPASNIETIEIELFYKPENLIAMVSENDVTLNWDAPPLLRSLIGYKIYKNGDYIAQIVASELTFLDENLANGIYQYQISAVYSNGISELTEAVTAMIEVLYPPQNLISEIDNNNVTLDWDSPVNRELLGYRIYRNNELLTATQVTQYYDLNLANGEYTYYVSSVYDSGESIPSNPTIASIELLYPPENLQFQVIDFIHAQLNWEYPSINGEIDRALLGYEVYRNAQLLFEVMNPAILSYLDANLMNGMYSYYIKAIYSSGISAASNEVTIYIEQPIPPVNLSVTVNEDDVTLHWQHLRDFQIFNIYRNNVLIDTTSAQLYTDLNLANGTYAYTVTSLYDSGESESSNEAVAIVEVLYPPTGLLTSVNDDDVTLNWNLPVTSGGLRDLINYKIYRDSYEIAEITDLTYTDFNLANGTYAYTVTALYDSGESESSNEAVAIVEVLYPPTGLLTSVNDDDVTLNWNLPVTSGGLRDLINYKIYRDSYQIAEATDLTYTDFNLANGTYAYSVTALYDSGESEPSNEAVAIVEVLYPPTGLLTSVNDDDVTLNWNLPVTNGGLRDLINYKIYRDSYQIAEATDLTYTDFNLANNTYTYSVTALYDSGESESSNEAVAIVEVLYPPTGLLTSVNDDEVTLNWNLPVTSGGLRDLINYKIYRDSYEIAETTDLNYTDFNLANGTYTYSVTALYDSGESESSNEAVAIVEVLYPPTQLSATVTNDDVNLLWQQPITQTNRSFLGYLLYRNSEIIANLNDFQMTSFDDLNLANGNYSYYVKASYTFGLSEPTNIEEVTVFVMPNLYPPQNLTGQIINENDVTLNWDAPENPETAIIGYKVYRNNLEISEVNNEQTNFNDFGLANGVYNYKIATVYNEGISSFSNSVVLNISVAYPPTGLIASVVNENNVALSWTAPNRNLISYIIYRNNVDIAVIDQNSGTYYLDENLANGMYEYYITAVYFEGISIPSNIAEIEIEVLYAPTNLVYEVQNENDVVLNWNAPVMRAFLGYKIYRNEIEIAQISETNYTDSNLTNGTYNYKVTALYDSGESASTNQVEVMIEVLYAPTNLVYEIQNENDVVLNWNAPAMRNFLGYKIYRNEIEIAQINETYYTDSNLTNGTYHYHVTALYDSGESASSNQVEVMIEVLYAPTNLVYEVQNENDVVLNWNAPPMRAFLGYKVYRNEIEIAQISETNYTDSNLTNGTYNYKVTALYDSGESAYTNQVEVMIEVLYAPTNLVYEVQNENDVVLNWNAPAMRTFLGYKIYRNEIEIAQINETYYTDSNLTNGTYNYKVTALYDSGESASSNQVEVMIEVLYAPTNLVYEVQNENDVVLNWNAPPMRAFLGYKVYRNEIEIAQISETNYTDSNLTNGTYNYKVTALYDSGESASTNQVEVMIEVLYAPTNLVYEVQNENDVVLNWNAPPMRAFLGYKVYRNEIEIAQISETNYTDSNLTNGTYNYKVTALYDSGESASTNQVEVMIEVLYAPTNLVYEVQNENDVVLNWNAPPMRAFLGYKVYRNEIEIAQISETNYTDSNLTNGTYNYKVTALYDSGESAYTNQVEVMIEVLYAPTNLVYEVQNENDVVLNWNAPAMRTFLGYKIYRNEIEIAQINETYYTDSNLTNGTYNYKVTALYDSGESEPTNLVSVLIDVQTSVDEVINIQTTKMNNLYPNPFNPATNLSYQLAKDDFVTIVIYDIKGKKIKTLVEGYQTSGEYQIHWEGTKDDQSKAASGIYFFRMISGNYNSTRKAILLK